MKWESGWRDDYLRWVCGFASAEGGVLVLGRNDDGVVVGLPDTRRLLEELPNKVRDLPGIMVDVAHGSPAPALRWDNGQGWSCRSWLLRSPTQLPTQSPTQSTGSFSRLTRRR